MRLVQKDGCSFVVFDLLERTGLVNHCFSTRLGGVSQEVWDSLNVGFNRGDQKENVFRNIEILGNAVGFRGEDTVCLSQVHGTNLRYVTEKDRGEGFGKSTNLTGYDGLMTDRKNVTLVTYHADCVPLYFLDPVKKAIALSHAGWRGTVQKMAEVTVREMIRKFHSKPEDILCAIGPSIGVCCFEVDTPVAEEFKEKLDFGGQFVFPGACKDKYQIDLWGINQEILLRSGILPEHIEVTDLCTKCHPELFYSHRNMCNLRGTMAAYLELK